MNEKTPAVAEGTANGEAACQETWCGYPMPHEHSSSADKAITDWQAVAERTLHGAGQWKRRYETESAENDAWRDALHLRTADREFLDAARFEGNLRWAVGEVARRILDARPAEGTDVEACAEFGQHPRGGHADAARAASEAWWGPCASPDYREEWKP